jgi:hypothetical protein
LLLAKGAQGNAEALNKPVDFRNYNVLLPSKTTQERRSRKHPNLRFGIQRAEVSEVARLAKERGGVRLSMQFDEKKINAGYVKGADGKVKGQTDFGGLRIEGPDLSAREENAAAGQQVLRALVAALEAIPDQKESKDAAVQTQRRESFDEALKPALAKLVSMRADLAAAKADRLWRIQKKVQRKQRQADKAREAERGTSQRT